VYVSVESVRLNKSGMFILLGQTEQLTATIFPVDEANKNVTRQSNNENLATVNSTGLVNADATGTFPTGYSDSESAVISFPFQIGETEVTNELVKEVYQYNNFVWKGTA